MNIHQNTFAKLLPVRFFCGNKYAYFTQTNRGIRWVAVLVLIVSNMLVYSSQVNAAFCSLRDPIASIQNLYEGDYTFRSMVTTVTEEDRQLVKQLLPFTLHQSEVNKHTLYVMYKDEAHVGFLQARSEWAKWGLIEIAWAINVDRTIKGFYYQRCRSPACNNNVIQDITNVIKNKSFEELKGLLSANGKTLSGAGIKAFTQAPELALLTLRSALKTLAITDISWKKEIALATALPK